MKKPDDLTLFQAVECHHIPINVSSYGQALLELEHLLNLNSGHYICFFEGNLFHRSLRDQRVREAISGASLIYPDGVAASKELSWRLHAPAERVSGPTFFLKAMEYGVPRNWKHFFLGGGEGVAETLARKMQQQFPGIQIAGVHTPPFRELTEAEENELKAQIENSGAQLLWVALGGPKQEFWMQKHLRKINIPVMLGVGAAFDFHAGIYAWAPRRVRTLGMEWCYRAFSGGTRIFFRNLRCVSHVALVLLADALRFKVLGCSKAKLLDRRPLDPGQDSKIKMKELD